jgi:hypothetical protein
MLRDAKELIDETEAQIKTIDAAFKQAEEHSGNQNLNPRQLGARHSVREGLRSAKEKLGAPKTHFQQASDGLNSAVPEAQYEQQLINVAIRSSEGAEALRHAFHELRATWQNLFLAFNAKVTVPELQETVRRAQPGPDSCRAAAPREIAKCTEILQNNIATAKHIAARLDSAGEDAAAGVPSGLRELVHQVEQIDTEATHSLVEQEAIFRTESSKISHQERAKRAGLRKEAGRLRPNKIVQWSTAAPGSENVVELTREQAARDQGLSRYFAQKMMIVELQTLAAIASNQKAAQQRSEILNQLLVPAVNRCLTERPLHDDDARSVAASVVSARESEHAASSSTHEERIPVEPTADIHADGRDAETVPSDDESMNFSDFASQPESRNTHYAQQMQVRCEELSMPVGRRRSFMTAIDGLVSIANATENPLVDRFIAITSKQLANATHPVTPALKDHITELSRLARALHTAYKGERRPPDERVMKIAQGIENAHATFNPPVASAAHDDDASSDFSVDSLDRAGS